MSDAPDGAWANAEAYERYVGRWSRLVAREFIAWIVAPTGLRWLDVGCGTGELTRAITDLAAPSEVLGVDRSADYVDYARQHSGSDIEYRAGDATELTIGDDQFDVAVSGLVLNFVPDPERAAAEMIRVTRVGGTVAAYVWDYGEGMQLMRYFWDVAAEIDARAVDLDEGARFPVCRESGLAEMFAGVGLRSIESRAIVVPTEFANFEEYWGPFLGAQGPAPAFAMSLREADRERLRASLRERIPAAADGSIELKARAWAAKGTVSA